MDELSCLFLSCKGSIKYGNDDIVSTWNTEQILCEYLDCISLILLLHIYLQAWSCKITLNIREFQCVILYLWLVFQYNYIYIIFGLITRIVSGNTFLLSYFAHVLFEGSLWNVIHETVILHTQLKYFIITVHFIVINSTLKKNLIDGYKV
jgi:hypothetical protein